MTLFDTSYNAEARINDLTAQGESFKSLTFQDCVFTHCALTECTFEACVFETCTFTGCDLSLTLLPRTRFKGVTFTESRLMGVNWCDADWERGSLLATRRVDFDGCLLDHALFIGLDLKETNFKGCRARGADFENADLTRTNFSGADLEGARFVGCDLTEADFTLAAGYAINAAENTLHKTRFSLPEAVALLHSLDIVLEE